MNNEAWYLRQMPYQENYESAKKRIDKAETAGCFLDDDYARLDKTLCKKLIKLEVKTWKTH